MKRGKTRDQQWSSIRRVEFIYMGVSLAALFALLILTTRRPTSDLFFWIVSGVVMLTGVMIWVRQYQVLDELGRLRFLKSWMVSGIVTLSGLTWALLWSVYQSIKQSGATPLSTVPTLSFWFVYLSLVAGLVAMGLTNLYLRAQDERSE